MLDSLFDSTRPASARSIAERAGAVRERWSRLGAAHIPVAFGCSCGMAGAHVTVADFELDLVDFIEATVAGREIPAPVAEAMVKKRVAAILDALDQCPDAEVSLVVLVALERAIGSFKQDANRASDREWSAGPR